MGQIMARTKTRQKKTKPGILDGKAIPLEYILEIVDWQVSFYEGEEREALIKASNAIYDHIHKDDPDEYHGN